MGLQLCPRARGGGHVPTFLCGLFAVAAILGRPGPPGPTLRLSRDPQPGFLLGGAAAPASQEPLFPSNAAFFRRRLSPPSSPGALPRPRGNQDHPLSAPPRSPSRFHRRVTEPLLPPLQGLLLRERPIHKGSLVGHRVSSRFDGADLSLLASPPFPPLPRVRPPPQRRESRSAATPPGGAPPAIERASESLRDLRVAEVVEQDVSIDAGKVEAPVNSTSFKSNRATDFSSELPRGGGTKSFPRFLPQPPSAPGAANKTHPPPPPLSPPFPWNLGDGAPVLRYSRGAALLRSRRRFTSGFDESDGRTSASGRRFHSLPRARLPLEERGQRASNPLHFRGLATGPVGHHVSNISKLLDKLLCSLFYSGHYHPRVCGCRAYRGGLQ